MEQDYTPCSTMLNSRPTYGGWSPRSSSGGRAGQMVTLKWALTTSNNWISARLTADLLPANLANKMRLFGITGHLDATMPLCLGPNDVSVAGACGGIYGLCQQRHTHHSDTGVPHRGPEGQCHILGSAAPH